MRAYIWRAVIVPAGVLALAAPPAHRPAAAQGRQLDERSRREAVRALAPGKLLVAARHLPDPNFARSVILLSAFTDDGAVGFIVNRRTQVTLREMFPHLPLTTASRSLAFFGGPVGTRGIVALVRGSSHIPSARPIGGGVSLVSSREGLESLIAATAPAAEFRVYLGYAGWGSGQLEAETMRGAWHVLDGDTDVVFDREPSSTWQRQIARTEALQARRADPRPLHPGGPDGIRGPERSQRASSPAASARGRRAGDAPARAADERPPDHRPSRNPATATCRPRGAVVATSSSIGSRARRSVTRSGSSQA